MGRAAYAAASLRSRPGSAGIGACAWMQAATFSPPSATLTPSRARLTPDVGAAANSGPSCCQESAASRHTAWFTATCGASLESRRRQTEVWAGWPKPASPTLRQPVKLLPELVHGDAGGQLGVDHRNQRHAGAVQGYADGEHAGGAVAGAGKGPCPKLLQLQDKRGAEEGWRSCKPQTGGMPVQPQLSARSRLKQCQQGRAQHLPPQHVPGWQNHTMPGNTSHGASAGPWNACLGAAYPVCCLESVLQAAGANESVSRAAQDPSGRGALRCSSSAPHRQPQLPTASLTRSSRWRQPGP